MKRVRPVDFDAFDPDRYSTQYLFQGESCVMIGSNVPPGKPAFAHHRHLYCDQIYYIVQGEMHVVLGTEERVIGPDSLVFIPQGLPHHNWNAGEIAEFHLEVLAPAPRANLALATPTDDVDAGGLVPVVVAVDPANMVPSVRFPGFRLNHLLRVGGPSVHAAVYVGEVDPGAGGPGTHVHAFDQFYFVLEGELTVELGFDRFTVGPRSLVTIPAGVPHRQWNASSVMERHVALNCPTPPAGVPIDIGVTFAANGESV